MHITVDAAGGADGGGNQAHAGTTTLSVSDDGIGFDRAAEDQGPGIAAMRAFAAVLQGTVHIDSVRGTGTTVIVQLNREPDVAPPQQHLRLVPAPDET